MRKPATDHIKLILGQEAPIREPLVIRTADGTALLTTYKDVYAVRMPDRPSFAAHMALTEDQNTRSIFMLCDVDEGVWNMYIWLQTYTTNTITARVVEALQL